MQTIFLETYENSESDGYEDIYPGRNDLADELGLDSRYLFPVHHDSSETPCNEWVYLPKPESPQTPGLSQHTTGIETQKC